MAASKRRFINGSALCFILTLLLIFSNQGRPALAEQLVEPAVQAESIVFTDLTADMPLMLCANYLYDKGIFSGFPDGSFRPAESLTRAQAARIVDLAGSIPISDDSTPTFSDVSPSHWAYGEIEAAVNAGLLTGYPDGTFKPDSTITRAEAVILLLNLSKEELSQGKRYISDVSTDNWAYPYIETAIEAGLVEMADDSTFQPDLAMRRGEMARGVSAMLTLSPSLRSAELTGMLTVKNGSVTLITGGTEHKLTGEILIGTGSTIITGSDSQAEIIFDDGSGILIDENTEIAITKSSGFSYMRQNGTAGVAVDKLTVKLVKGRIFGGLASHNEVSPQAAAYKEKYITLASIKMPPGLASLLLAEGDGTPEVQEETPWWAEPYTEYERVEVNMPWGTGGIRGTFWMCQIDDKHIFSVATGKADVRASGSTVEVIGSQYTEIPSAGAPPNKQAAMSQALKQQWVNNNNWVMERLQGIENNLPLPPAPAILPVLTPVEQPPVLLNQGKAEIDYINSVNTFNQISESLTFAPPSAASAGGGGGGGGGSGPSADSIAPAVSATPAGGSVPVDGSITVGFSENIQAGTVFGLITVTNIGGAPVNLNTSVSGASLIITPVSDLAYNTTYTVFIPEGALEDRAGNDVAEYSFNFTTAAAFINSYTITFDSAGGNAVPAITQDYGSEVAEPAAPAKEGYTFAGWSPAVPDTIPAADLTVVAQWTANEYTITFDSAGGSVVPAITQDYGSEVVAPAAPVKEGYTFAGWSPAVPGTIPAADLTVVAQWTANGYTIVNFPDPNLEAVVRASLDKTTGDVTSEDMKSLISLNGNNVNIIDLTGLEYAINLEKLFMQNNMISDISPINKMTNLKQILLQHNMIDNISPLVANNGLGRGDKVSLEHNLLDLTPYSQDMNDINELIKRGVIVTYKPKDTVVTVNFESNGGSVVGSISVDYNSTISEPAAPTLTGYTFNGWYKEAALTNQWNFTTDMVTGDTTLYAGWSIA
jgi:uncharacterized repeat protein (TIGR02543 family)